MKQPTANALLKALLALGYVGVVLRKPLTWLAALVALALWWTLRQHREAQREASRPPPIEFASAATPKAAPAAATPQEQGEPDEEMKDEPAVIPSAVLETAVGRFHRDHRRVPRDFEELETERYIVGVPKPPAGMRYHLDLRRMRLLLVRKDLVPRP